MPAEMRSARMSTGNLQLDSLLGGGLIPGTLTVVVGATGIGKTQLGLQFAHAGKTQEGEPGIIFDLTSRGDAQNQPAYAQRMFDWSLRTAEPATDVDPAAVWDRTRARSDYFHIFERSGRRVTRDDLSTEEWQDWKAELNRKLEQTISFFYANFVHGVRRCVIDGVEPADRASDSFQFHVFNYIYHQILHKDADWVARDLFRVHFREQEARVRAAMYDHQQIGSMLLATSHETLLDDLLSRPIEAGDELTNANTIILMGKIRDGLRMRRALHIAKHRGSAVSDAIVPFEINEWGLVLEP